MKVAVKSGMGVLLSVLSFSTVAGEIEKSAESASITAGAPELKNVANKAESNHSTKVEASSSDWSKKLIKAAKQRTRKKVTYNGRYVAIKYPGGDVPDNIGVCTDVVIRSYRKLGVDLQQLVHEDMKNNFEDYPKIWGHTRPDTNIDHRRVPNLQTFFKRQGASLTVSSDPKDYQPGDLVTWMLPGNLPHIGIVSDNKNSDGSQYLILHNIGFGPKQDDFLFGAKITGHYRYKVD